MKVQTIFRIFLVIIVLVLSVMAFRSIMRPEKFKMVYTEREKEIRNRLTTIRAAQQVYKLENKKYAENIDDLVKFIKDGNITIVKISGSIPEGMSEKDAFLKNFQFIPENNGKKFEIQTAKIQNDFQVYRIDVPLDNILANMQRSISPKNTNFITKGINAILYNGLEQEKQYKNLYKPMWLGSLTEAVTTGSWE